MTAGDQHSMKATQRKSQGCRKTLPESRPMRSLGKIDVSQNNGESKIFRAELSNTVATRHTELVASTK